MLKQKTIDELIISAKEVRLHAYAPYSNFLVGAAVLCGGKNIFKGCNVENVALGLSICAERSAIVQAFSHGCKDLQAIAIVTDVETPSAPCGICRQVIYEFNPSMIIIMANLKSDMVIKTIKELLPLAFERERVTSFDADFPKKT